MHELGHAIGLKHTRDQDNIMFPCTVRGKRVYPGFEDISQFHRNHDLDIGKNLWPTLMGTE